MEVVWRFLVALIRPYSLSAIPGIFFGYFEKKLSHLILRISKEGNRFDAFSIRFPPTKVRKTTVSRFTAVCDRANLVTWPGSDDVLFNS